MQETKTTTKSLGWEPITTLPLDHFTVLLWDGSDVSIGGRTIGMMDRIEAYTGLGLVEDSSFTHWMPLPTPPERMWSDNDQT